MQISDILNQLEQTKFDIKNNKKDKKDIGKVECFREDSCFANHHHEEGK